MGVSEERGTPLPKPRRSSFHCRSNSSPIGLAGMAPMMISLIAPNSSIRYGTSSPCIYIFLSTDSNADYLYPTCVESPTIYIYIYIYVYIYIYIYAIYDVCWVSDHIYVCHIRRVSGHHPYIYATHNVCRVSDHIEIRHLIQTPHTTGAAGGARPGDRTTVAPPP